MGERGPPKGEGGRPRAEIDLAVLRRAAAIGCTNEELAVVVGVCSKTFYDHLKQDPDMQQAIDEGRQAGRTTLRRLQWQRANAGSDTMLIWLGKQLLGQRDKAQIEADVNGTWVVQMPPETSSIDEWLERYTPEHIKRARMIEEQKAAGKVIDITPSGKVHDDAAK